MTTLSLSDQARLATVTADAQRLLNLDAVWTARLQSPMVPGDVAPLQAIVKEMQQLLVGLEAESEWLVALSEQIDDAKATAVLAALPLADSAKQSFLDKMKAQGGIAATAKQHFAMLKTQGPIERADLVAKIGKISTGQHTPGDISAKGQCICGMFMFCGGVMFAETGVGAAAAVGGAILCIQTCGQ